MNKDSDCGCSTVKLTDDLRVVSVRLEEELKTAAGFFPDAVRGVKTGKDLAIHKFAGSIGGVPADSVELYSVDAGGKRGSASRRFHGRVGREEFVYTLSATFVGDGQVRFDVKFEAPKAAKRLSGSFTYDLKRRWIVETKPGLLGKPAYVQRGSPVRKTVMLMGKGGWWENQHWDWECLLHVVIHTLGVCGWLCVGLPGPQCLPLIIICAGPSIIAALIGCKEDAPAA
jgi:hypothetical protein